MRPRRSVRLRLSEALEPVIGDGLPRRRVGNECAPARPHAGIAVERPHADAHLRWVIGIAAEQVRAALAAEAFLESAVGMAPSSDEFLSLQQPEGATVDQGLSRSSCSGAALAASAVAVARGWRGLGELKTDAAAQATPGH